MTPFSKGYMSPGVALLGIWKVAHTLLFPFLWYLSIYVFLFISCYHSSIPRPSIPLYLCGFFAIPFLPPLFLVFPDDSVRFASEDLQLSF